MFHILGVTEDLEDMQQELKDHLKREVYIGAGYTDYDHNVFYKKPNTTKYKPESNFDIFLSPYIGRFCKSELSKEDTTNKNLTKYYVDLLDSPMLYFLIPLHEKEFSFRKNIPDKYLRFFTTDYPAVVYCQQEYAVPSKLEDYVCNCALKGFVKNQFPRKDGVRFLKSDSICTPYKMNPIWSTGVLPHTKFKTLFPPGFYPNVQIPTLSYFNQLVIVESPEYGTCIVCQGSKKETSYFGVRHYESHINLICKGCFKESMQQIEALL